MFVQKSAAKTSIKKRFIALIFVFLSGILCWGQSYPEISDLKSRNILFSQYQDQVQQATMDIFRDREPEMMFYSYTCKENDTLFTIASRCSILYDTIVTANDIQDTEQDLTGKKIILPTVSGLFIPLDPASPIEVLLYGEYAQSIKQAEEEAAQNLQQQSSFYPIYKIQGRSFYFLQGERFTMAARAFFLNPEMVLPLEQSVLTSSYGMRISPISGNWRFHHGIDMAAPLGSSVLCCKSGKVLSVTKNDPTYGNYIIIEHSNGMTSLYAHLSEILVQKNQVIRTGQIIGKVGLTGLTTGPHLHFEIRINGESRDPQDFY